MTLALNFLRVAWIWDFNSMILIYFKHLILVWNLSINIYEKEMDYVRIYNPCFHSIYTNIQMADFPL